MDLDVGAKLLFCQTKCLGGIAGEQHTFAAKGGDKRQCQLDFANRCGMKPQPGVGRASPKTTKAFSNISETTPPSYGVNQR